MDGSGAGCAEMAMLAKAIRTRDEIKLGSLRTVLTQWTCSLFIVYASSKRLVAKTSRRGQKKLRSENRWDSKNMNNQITASTFLHPRAAHRIAPRSRRISAADRALTT